MEDSYLIRDVTFQGPMTSEKTSYNIDEEYGYLFTDSVKVDKKLLLTELKCPICHDIMQDVVIVMSCLDRFCYECIEHCLRSEHVQNACPCCRKRIPSRRSLRKDVCFDAIINQLKKSLIILDAVNNKNSSSHLINIESGTDNSAAVDSKSHLQAMTTKELTHFSQLQHVERTQEMRNKCRHFNDARIRKLEWGLTEKHPNGVHREKLHTTMRNIQICRCILLLWPDVRMHSTLLDRKFVSGSHGASELRLLELEMPYLNITGNVTVFQVKEYIARMVYPTQFNSSDIDPAINHRIIQYAVINMDLLVLLPEEMHVCGNDLGASKEAQGIYILENDQIVVGAVESFSSKLGLEPHRCLQIYYRYRVAEP